MKRILILFAGFFVTEYAIGQITENFDDGDFSDGSPLTWTASQTSGGDDFIITSGEIQSNGPAASGDLYLVTDLGIDFANNDVVWSFKARYEGGGPSGSNRIEIYLISDIQDISGSPQGYYIGMGESGSTDGIDFFKTSTGTALINDGSDLVGAGIDIHVRITRTNTGMWTLEADATGGDTFSTIGTVTDTDFTSGDYFGFYVQHTSTRFDDFYFDDFTVTTTPLADTDPPTIQSITAISDTQVDVTFNESVDETTAQVTGNYAIDGGSISVTNAERDATNNEVVHLTVSTLTNGETYTVTINNVEDESNNVIAADSEDTFEYLVTEAAEVGDIVVNEFHASPDAMTAMPNAEFIELLNISNKFIDLEDWTFSDASGTSDVFTSTIIRPDEYLILTATGNESLFSGFGDVLEVGNFRALNNSGDDIIIADGSSTTIFETSYTSSSAGISTELINPNGPDYSSNNYGLSIDSDGGTPGEQNSIFDDTPDTTNPSISSIDVVSATELDLTFSEPLEETSAETTTNYTIDGGISVSNAERDDSDNSIVHLTVSTLPSGEVRELTINNVTDLSGNAIGSNSTIEFEYIETETAEAGDVVINEFYAIPDEESGIPNAEYIELLNISDKFIDLENWTFSDASDFSGSFDSFILRPGSYVILTSSGEGVSFESFGDVLEISSFRSLNNSGDDITITNENLIDIHSISYSSATSGISTELINPNGPDYSSNNYGLSTDPDGGTPGEQNSIFDDTPDTTSPSLAGISVVSATELDLTYSEPVEETSAENIANYAIDGGITVSGAVLDVDDALLVHLTVSTLVSEDIRTLTVNNVQDLVGNLIATNSSIEFEYLETEAAEEGDVVINEFLANPTNDADDFVELYNRSDKFIDILDWKIADESSTSEGFDSFILRPGAYIIIYDEDATIDYTAFGDAIAVPSLTLNNSDDQVELLDNLDTRIAFIAYSEDVGDGFSFELVNPVDPCINEFSYLVSQVGSSPGAENSVFDDTPDTTAPTIVSTSLDGSSLTVLFSETMDGVSLSSGSYVVNGLTVAEVNVGESLTDVALIFNETLTQGIVYELSISNVQDCWGNEIVETVIEFGSGRTPMFNELIITEIHFDPDPAQGLPEVEYLEVLNTTSDLISLASVSFSDATSTVDLPSVAIPSGAYYVLTTNAGVSEFSGINVVGVTSFPSLNNDGEQLLFTIGDELIFSIEYSPDWHEEEKSEGGFSLEMIDITNPCGDSENWTSSTNINGGTPGAANSVTDVIPDNFGPEPVQAIATSANQVKIDFNERIDPTAEMIGVVSFEPSLEVASLTFDYLSPKSITVALSTSLVENQEHQITISNITDCNGNEVQGVEVSVALPSAATTSDILLSEVLFNPRTNGVDFVEVYNNSQKFISLRDWQLARITDSGISDEKIIANEELILTPGGYMALTTDVTILLTNYPQGASENFLEVSSLPTYANDTGNVVLLNGDDIVQDLFHYEDDYHYNLLESTDGVSLERISFSSPTNDPNNWRSASSTVGFATPGYGNSQALDPTQASIGNIQAEPKVFIPGNSGSGRDFTTINYQFDQPGKFANITIYDQTGRTVKNLAEGILLSTSGFLQWDGTTNDGELARLGYYVVIFELFDSSGSTEVMKETIVVGRDF